MKLFWKVFLSTMATALLAFSAGGFFLIDTQFRSSLSRETTTAREENLLLCRLLEQQTASAQEELILRGIGENELQPGGRLFSSVLRQALTRMENSYLRAGGFRLCEKDGKTLYGSLGNTGSVLISRLSPTQQGSELFWEESLPVLHTAGPVQFGQTVYYLENVRELSALFENRDAQYRTYCLLALAMTAACAGLSLLLSRWIVSPVQKLSRIARKAAQGDLSQKAPVSSQDELGTLSRDFNVMITSLKEHMEALEEENRRREDFTASFAHELKTPLTSMIGYADLLRSQRLKGEDSLTAANYIFTQGKRLESLSMKLLELIVLDKRDFTFQPVEIKSFLEKIGQEMSPIFKEAKIHFSCYAKPALLSLEPDLIQTVCLNLLDNARKATPNGAILLFGENTPQGYLIAVRDTGKGIPPEELKKITEPFYMVDKSRSRSQGGAGLGLALCQKVAELHGGELRFYSEPGEGTLACFFLKGGVPSEKGN